MGWGESISKFVSDGYQKFQSIRKDWAVKEGEKETMLQGLVRKAGIPVDNIKAIYSWQGKGSVGTSFEAFSGIEPIRQQCWSTRK